MVQGAVARGSKWPSCLWHQAWLEPVADDRHRLRLPGFVRAEAVRRQPEDATDRRLLRQGGDEPLRRVASSANPKEAKRRRRMRDGCAACQTVA
jgi:hypothetical protein